MEIKRDPLKVECDGAMTELFKKLIKDKTPFTKIEWKGDRFKVLTKDGSVFVVTKTGFKRVKKGS